MGRTHCVRLLNSSYKWRGKCAIGPNPKLQRLCPGFGNLIGSTAWNSAVFLLLFEKWKLLSCVRLFVTPWDYTVHGILQAGILEWVAFPFSRGSSQPRDWSQVFRISGRFFYQLNHQGSPRILEGSLSLLQHIFPTQESNWSLLHCRQIL